MCFSSSLRVSMVVINYVILFYMWPDRRDLVCKKTRKSYVRDILIKVKARKACKVRKDVPDGLMMGKGRIRAGVQARKVCINDG